MRRLAYSGVYVLCVIAAAALLFGSGCGRGGGVSVPSDGDTPPREQPTGGRAVDADPVAPGLADQWSSLCEYREFPEEAWTDFLSLSVDAAGAITHLLATVYVEQDDATCCRYRVHKEEAQGDTEFLQGEVQPCLEGDDIVPVRGILDTLDKLRLALSEQQDRTDSGAGYKVRVSQEDGKVFPSDTHYSWYTLSGGVVEPLGVDTALACSGRIVVLLITPDQGQGFVSVRPGQGQAVLLKDYCGAVEQLGAVELRANRGGRTLGLKVADFDGDGAKEYLYIVGRKDSSGRSYDRFLLLVTPEPDGTGETIPLPAGGVTAYHEFLARDLTNDGIPELVHIEEHVSDGSAERRLAVLRIRAAALEACPLFMSVDHAAVPGLEATYTEGGRVRISAKSAGVAWEIDLGDLRGRPVDPAYDRLAAAGFMSDAPGSFERLDLGDVDRDGCVEIIGHQPLYGVDESDHIADLRRVFSWDPEADRFVPGGIELYAQSGGRGVRIGPDREAH